MSEKTKNVLLAVLIVGLVSMTVAYAALSQTLNINGSAQVASASNWDVHFDDEDGSHDPIETVGYAATTTANDTITLTDTTVTAPDVTLKAPGDKVSFYFDVENGGTINAKLSTLPTNVTASTGVMTGYTVAYSDNSASDATLTALTSDIVVKLTYADGTAIAANDPLYYDGSGSTPIRRDLVLSIEYVKNTEAVQELPAKSVTITGISSTLTYVQN